MSSPSISGVSHGRSCQNPYGRGRCHDQANFVRMQPAFAKQRRQEGRLHTERRIEQSVDREEPGEYCARPPHGRVLRQRSAAAGRSDADRYQRAASALDRDRVTGFGTGRRGVGAGLHVVAITSTQSGN